METEELSTLTVDATVTLAQHLKLLTLIVHAVAPTDTATLEF
jgi:hypothetical protein